MLEGWLLVKEWSHSAGSVHDSLSSSDLTSSALGLRVLPLGESVPPPTAQVRVHRKPKTQIGQKFNACDQNE